jgi:hypothetical protein
VVAFRLGLTMKSAQAEPRRTPHATRQKTICRTLSYRCLLIRKLLTASPYWIWTTVIRNRPGFPVAADYQTDCATAELEYEPQEIRSS